jgi:hypothetical protein
MKRQFTFQEFVEPVTTLAKNDFFIYPANAYQTVQRVKRILGKEYKRVYLDQAVSKTERIFIREK